MAERRTVSQQIKVFHPWSEQGMPDKQFIFFLAKTGMKYNRYQ